MADYDVTVTKTWKIKVTASDLDAAKVSAFAMTESVGPGGVEMTAIRTGDDAVADDLYKKWLNADMPEYEGTMNPSIGSTTWQAFETASHVRAYAIENGSWPATDDDSEQSLRQALINYCEG